MPRVPLIAKEDLPQDKHGLYEQMAARRGHVASPFAALLNSPEVASRVALVGEQLRYVSPSIAPEVREIITLTTAKALKCQYIWTHHCPSAKEVGVRDEVVEAIRNGGRPRGLLPKESVFIQFTQELLEDKQVRDATYGAVEHLLGQQAVVDLVVTIGYYTMLCLAINALQVNLEEGVAPNL
jgi:4-carboxymuconolactone decarboxylase